MFRFLLVSFHVLLLREISRHAEAQLSSRCSTYPASCLIDDDSDEIRCALLVRDTVRLSIRVDPP